jgi:hypothetical protein
MSLTLSFGKAKDSLGGNLFHAKECSWILAPFTPVKFPWYFTLLLGASLPSFTWSSMIFLSHHLVEREDDPPENWTELCLEPATYIPIKKMGQLDSNLPPFLQHQAQVFLMIILDH